MSLPDVRVTQPQSGVLCVGDAVTGALSGVYDIYSERCPGTWPARRCWLSCEIFVTAGEQRTIQQSMAIGGPVVRQRAQTAGPVSSPVICDVQTDSSEGSYRPNGPLVESGNAF